MNNQLLQEQNLLEIKRFLNRISDISFSYNDIKKRIYNESIPLELQLSLLTKLKYEALRILEDIKHETGNN
jgi:hypothetical protein